MPITKLRLDNAATLRSMDTPATPNTPDNELTPDRLQDELAKYQAALKQEFELAEKAADGFDPLMVEASLKKFWLSNAPMSAAQIVWLAQFADSETVKLKANQFVIEQAKELSEAENDPVKRILMGLMKESTPAEEAAITNNKANNPKNKAKS